MTNLRRVITRSLLVIAMVAVGLALAPALAHADPITFTVVEGVVPGAFPNTIYPNNITAKYDETLTLTATTFSANLLVSFTDYALNGTNLINQIGTNTGGDVFANEYGLYAIVQVEGTYTVAADPSDASQLVYDFDPLTSTANIYVNPDQLLGGDLLIMTASLIDPLLSDGNVTVSLLTGAVITGDFAVVYTNATVLSGLGQAYWPTLYGLVLKATSSGDVDPPSSITATGGRAFGDASLSFEGQAVPEPASLTLLGMGLLSGGFVARRRRTKA